MLSTLSNLNSLGDRKNFRITKISNYGGFSSGDFQGTLRFGSNYQKFYLHEFELCIVNCSC